MYIYHQKFRVSSICRAVDGEIKLTFVKLQLTFHPSIYLSYEYGYEYEYETGASILEVTLLTQLVVSRKLPSRWAPIVIYWRSFVIQTISGA